MGTTFFATDLYFAPSISRTIKTESYIGEIPMPHLSFLICFRNGSDSSIPDTSQVCLITSEVYGIERDKSKIKSSFRPLGLGFSELNPHIPNAFTALFINLGTSDETGSIPGDTSSYSEGLIQNALYVSQLRRSPIGITFCGTFNSGRFIKIDLPFLSPFSHNCNVTPISCM